MRIGIDARLWNESGVGRYLRNLIWELERIDKRNEYTLFFRKKEFNSVEISSSNFKKRLADIRWHTIQEQILLPSIFKKEKLDLLHFPYFSVPIFYNLPFIVTIHDLILHHFPTGEASTLPTPVYMLKQFGYKNVVSYAVRKAKKIITVSNSTKEDIISTLNIDSSKIVVAYEGVDKNLLIKRNEGTIGQAINNYFLYVGNAYPHKNLNRLLEAFNILTKKDPNLTLVFVGKDDYFYKRLREKVKRINLIKNIVFLGETKDSELISLYSNAIALIAPSLIEGFGLPVLEAMSQDCLVLASDIAVHKEIAGDAAVYFNPFDIDDLYKNMEKTYKNRNNFTEKIKSGAKRVKAFSWKKMAKETLNTYESCTSL